MYISNKPSSRCHEVPGMIWILLNSNGLVLLQVFAAAGLQSPIAASIITGGVNLLFTIAAAVVMDK